MLIGTVIAIAAAALLLIGISYWAFGLWKLPIRPVVIGPDEMAVRVILGKPDKFLDSGLQWIPLFFQCYVVKYPRKWYNHTYSERAVVTNEDSNYQGREYGAQVIQVDAVAYMRFPQSENLIKILQSGIPTKDEELEDWTEESVVGALRVAIGNMSWKQATEDISEVRRRADAVFKDSDGALMKAGFEEDDLRLTIKEIKLPKALQDALPQVDEERLKSEAAKFLVIARARETVGTVIEMMAQSRKKTIEEIQIEIEADADLQIEFRQLAKDLVVRQIAIDGKSFVDIRVEGAGGIEKTILEIAAAWQRMPKGGESGVKKTKKTKTVMHLGVPIEVSEEDEEN